MRFLSLVVTATSAILATALGSVCRLVSLSGGGSHGAYESGVLNRLVNEEGWKPWDVHLGVSAGSLGILSLMKNDYNQNLDLVRQIWWETKTSDILDPLHSNNSLSGHAKIIRLIQETFDQLTGSPSPGIFRAGVTDLDNGKFVSLPLDTGVPDLSRILASTSIPLVFPPVRIPELGFTAVDGGLQSNEIFLSGLQYCPEGTTSYEMDLLFAYYQADEDHHPTWSFFEILLRTVDLIKSDYNNLFFKQVSECSRIGSDVRVTIHMPSSPSKISTLDFDHGEELWREGFYNSTSKIIYC
jgi:hypothetical protein